MKKLSIFILSVVAFFIPLFFCNAAATITVSNITQTSADIKVSGSIGTKGLYTMLITNNSVMVDRILSPLVLDTITYSTKKLKAGNTYVLNLYSGLATTGDSLATATFKSLVDPSQKPIITVNNWGSKNVNLKVDGLTDSTSFKVDLKAGSTIAKTFSGVGNQLVSFEGLNPSTSYTAFLYIGAETVDKSNCNFTTLESGTLSINTVRPYSVTLDVTSSKKDIIVDIATRKLSDPEGTYLPNPSSKSGITDELGKAIITLEDLSPNTKYRATLSSQTEENLAYSDFTTSEAPKVGITAVVLSASSVRLEINNLIPYTDNTLFIKYDDGTTLDPSSFVASAIEKSDSDGVIKKEFTELTIGTAYIGGISVQPKGGDSYIETAKFKTSTVQENLDFTELNKTIDDIKNRISLNVEGALEGNYAIGSKKILQDALAACTECDSKNGFYSQEQIATANTTLQDAITLFETKRVGGVKTPPKDLSSKAGGLIPKCPAEGCGFNQLMELVNNVINFLLFTIATPLAALVICYAGWLYLSSGGSSENITKAKKILKNVLIGYIIGLAAWLIVSTIIKGLGINSTNTANKDTYINTFLK